jgi:hypothetical protein
LNVNFNVLKQVYCALVGVIKDWISQNAWYNCGNCSRYFVETGDFIFRVKQYNGAS